MSQDIAIIGYSCRVPGAPDVESFWELLKNRVCAVTEIPGNRWAKGRFYHPVPGEAGRSYTWAAGTIGDLAGFDAGFFGIAPREAEQMDPHQRLLLEVVWEALEDSGLRASALAGSGTGVYVGASSTDYSNLRLGDPAGGNAYFMTGNTLSIVSNRISYIFDLHGPSLTVDTACSSSLFALDLACRAISAGQIPSAIVAGVNMLLSPFPYIGFCQASMLSKTGRCYAFDARADGYVRGEGAGAVVLKPLKDAIADGDDIRGVILGTRTNSDGRTVGLSLPNGVMQATLLRDLYHETEVEPADLTFVEAHGTGTQAGDPIEARAIGEVLGQPRDVPLPIGSVKTNIGHLEPASGIVGLIKATLSLERRLLPPSVFGDQPNPNIPFADLKLELVTDARALPATGRLLAGVNSFGFGGANGHCIIASPPSRADAETDLGQAALPPLLISARSEAALQEVVRVWSQDLTQINALEAGKRIRAAARRRDQHRYRLVIPGDTQTAMVAALNRDLPDMISGKAAGGAKLAFVFSGNGAQWHGMGRDAFHQSTAFRRAVAEVDLVLKPLIGWSVEDRLLHEEDEAALARTDISQPLVFAIQVGIVTALKQAGVEPDLCFGHSVGEIAAAWAAEALSLPEAARIIACRSREQQRTAGMGRMAAIGIGPEDTLRAIAEIGGGIELAAINSRSAVTVAGPADMLERLQEEAQRQNWRYTPLDLDYGFHSAIMEPIREDLLIALGGLDPSGSTEKFISTVSGGPLSNSRLDAQYWWHNVRDPVRFADAAAHAVAQGVRIFVEIGPHPIFQSYLRDALRAGNAEGRPLSTLTRRGTRHDPFPIIAAQCHVQGYDLSTSALFTGPQSWRNLPHYRWQREHHWYPATSEGLQIAGPDGHHPLLGYRARPGTTQWVSALNVEAAPWLGDHVVDGHAVLPAAAMIEIGLAAGRIVHPDASALEIEDLDIARAIVFEETRLREIRLALDRDGRLEIASRPRLADDPWAIHAIGRVRAAGQPAAPDAVIVPSVATAVSAKTLYDFATAHRLEYGAAFRLVDHVEIASTHTAIVHFTAPQDWAASLPDPGSFLLHPAAFDGALQGFFALIAQSGEDDPDATFLPARFGRIRAVAPFGRTPTRADLVISYRGIRSLCGTIAMYDAQGGVIALADECWFRRVPLHQAGAKQHRRYRFDLVAKLPAEDLTSPAAALTNLRFPAANDQAGSDAAALLEAYIVASAATTLKELLPIDQPIMPDRLAAHGRIGTSARPFLTALVTLLARYDVVEPAGDGAWRRLPDADLPSARDLWTTILGENPASAAELALAAMMAEALPSILAGHAAPSLPPALLAQSLYGSPSGGPAIEALISSVLDIARLWPQGRPLRLLEVGAASGTLTRLLLPRLAALVPDLVYVASDPEQSDISLLEQTTGAYPGSRAVQWDPASRETPASLVEPFDIAVSAWRLGFLGIADDLGGIADRLAKGGILVAVEAEPAAFWDMLMGSKAGWWQHESLSPLLSGENWRTALESAGLAPIDIHPAAVAPWTANLLIARQDQAPTGARLRAETGPAYLVGGSEDPMIAALGSALPLTTTGQTGAGDIIVPIQPTANIGTAALEIVALARDIIVESDAQEGQRPRLWIITRDAQQPMIQENGPGTTGAAIWGIARTLTNEFPGLTPRLVDLPSDWTPARAAAAIASELRQPDAETEIVWTDTGRHALRLRPETSEIASAGESGGPVGLAVRQPGLLDTLHWAGATTRMPADGEVAISVRASGLNFRDVMWALDLLPEEALQDGFAGATLGLECAGIVEAVGSGVFDLKPGDRVMAMAPATHASRVVTAALAVTHLPAHLSFVEGATIPVACLTTVYAVGYLGRLEAGEKILIHGGAGGVGLAAIQYAKHLGAEIFATAGSPAKRAFLRELGVDHVLDSRSLSFVDDVRRLTEGKGVDMVLNSLGGDAMEQSIGLLKPFGRFLELGKRDFYQNTRIGVRPLRQNVSYFAVDVDRLPLQRPALAKRLLGEVRDLLESGALMPLPNRAFRFADTAEAFRLMQASGHIGKLVLVPDAAEPHAPPAHPAFEIDPEATYLIAGGLGGFGKATARWLAEKGARHIALTGRRGAADLVKDADLAVLISNGIDVRAFACDITDETALSELLSRIRAEMPALRGVFHTAMVVDDGMLVDLTAARFESVLAPKLDGARHLDRLTRDDRLDLFVLFSSATTVLGAAGQGNYVAANMTLEALARHRHAAGLPALAVAWGPIADVGYLAREDAKGDDLSRRLAALPMTAQNSLDLLPAMIASGQPVIICADVNWAALRRQLPILSAPLFADLASMAGDGEAEIDLRERLRDLDEDQATDLVAGLVAEEIARIMGSSVDRIDPARPLSEFGMDSLMALELRLAIERRLGVEMPLLSLSDSTTLRTLAARVVHAAGVSSPAEQIMVPVSTTLMRHEAEHLDTAPQKRTGTAA